MNRSTRSAASGPRKRDVSSDRAKRLANDSDSVADVRSGAEPRRSKSGRDASKRADRSSRAPSQPRALAMVEFIVSAGLAILEAEGPSALTTKNIAERAGVSVGSLYQYFADKDELVAAVYHQKTRLEFEQAKTWIHELDRLSVGEMIALMVRRVVARHRAHLELNPDFYREHSEFHSFGEWELDRDDRQTEDPTVWWLRTLFEARKDELRITNYDTAAFLVARGLSAILGVTMRRRPEAMHDDAFVDEVVDMLLRYVLPD